MDGPNSLAFHLGLLPQPKVQMRLSIWCMMSMGISLESNFLTVERTVCWVKQWVVSWMWYWGPFYIKMGWRRLVLIVPGLLVCVGTTKALLFFLETAFGRICLGWVGQSENFSDQKIRLFLTRVSRRGNFFIFVLPTTLSDELEWLFPCRGT